MFFLTKQLTCQEKLKRDPGGLDQNGLLKFPFGRPAGSLRGRGAGGCRDAGQPGNLPWPGLPPSALPSTSPSVSLPPHPLLQLMSPWSHDLIHGGLSRSSLPRAWVAGIPRDPSLGGVGLGKVKVEDEGAKSFGSGELGKQKEKGIGKAITLS